MSSENSSTDLNQASYRATAYEDQQWEIVGEFKGDETFIPEEFQVIGGSSLIVDPMFADYGGLPPPADTRTHAPVETKSTLSSLTFGQQKDEEVIDESIKIHPDELAAKLEEAREEGKMEAVTEAILKQQENLERLQQQINTILADMDAQTKERAAILERQALDFALEISKRLINDAVEINPEYILPIISEAMTKVGTATVRSVRVSPEDMEFINIIGIEKQLKEFDGTWTFQADPSIRSGCVVETSAGEVDYQIDAAWSRMRDKILTVGK